MISTDNIVFLSLSFPLITFRRKRKYLLVIFSICFAFDSISQDSILIVQRSQIIKYRKGYLITTTNDTLRGLIWIEGDGAKKSADASVNIGGLTGAMTGAMAAAADKPNDEYYSLKDYYVQKQPGNDLVLIPKGEKNFREAFYPLIRDNPGFLQGIVGQPFDYYHVRDFVQLYNAMINRK